LVIERKKLLKQERIMPVGTRKIETTREDLKSLPGAWIELRQLSYDEMLERRDGATQILMERGIKNADSQQMAVKVLNRWSNQYSFPRCIEDHNITDEQGVKLDFSRPERVFPILDPKVGAEIEALIDKLNQEDEVGEDFTPVPDSLSVDGEKSPETTSEAS
jgi:hypothetical protein